MVTGLDIFRAHFRNYADRYVLICGAGAMVVDGLPMVGPHT
jgi:hypothetical protein